MTYTVKENDLGNKFTNKANATVTGDPDVPVKPGEVTNDTDARNPHLTVVKTTEDKKEKYALGDTIYYKVVVTNDGNVTMKNVVVEDQLPGVVLSDREGNTNAPVDLKPGEAKIVYYEYKIGQEDLGKVIVNNATATYTPDVKDPDTEEPPVTPGKTEDPTDDRNPKLEVVKEVTSKAQAADGKYVLGETVTYEVTVTNIGNLTMNDIIVSDAMTRWDGTITRPSSMDEVGINIGSLAPGESKTITYTHVIAEADLGGNLTNVATADGTPDIPNPKPEEKPDPDPTGKDDETIITEDPSNCTITVTKQSVSGLDDPIILATGAQFNVALFSDEAMTKQVGDVKTITYDGNSSTAAVTFDGLQRGTYYVAEVDAAGQVLTAGEYNGGAFVPVYGDGNSVVITENGGTAEFRFTNAFLVLPVDYYDAKTVTITKNVKDIKGKDAKSKETFYAGIFTDAGFTRLAGTDVVGENIIPLKMNGKSSVSTSIEVKVPQNGDTVKLYITEVTSAGKPVGDSFAYDVEVDNGELSLNKETVEETVTITNTSNKEEENTKTSTKEENSSNTTTTSTSAKAVRTGDDTPILPYTGMLGISALYILIFLAKRRRREDEA